MDSLTLLDYIIDIRETSSTNEKIKKITNYSRIELFKEVLYATYNTQINYYIKKFPEIDLDNLTNQVSLAEILHFMLNKLATREITGNAAIQEFTDILQNSNKNDIEVIKLVLQRDLDAGISITTINKAIPNFLPDNKKLYMRCSNFDPQILESWSVEKVIIQEKMDGVYCNLVNNDGVVNFITRNGKTLKLFEHKPELFDDIIKDFEDHTGSVIQGELLFIDSDIGLIVDRQIGNGMFNSKNKSIPDSYKPLFVAWDYIPYKYWLEGRFNNVYYIRYSLLYTQLGQAKGIKVIDNYLVDKDIHIINDFLAAYVNNGKEGIVIKNPEGIWEGKTSKNQLKYKKEITVDLKVRDVLSGKNGSRLGKPSILSCVSEDNLLEVNVGIGFTDEIYKYLEENNVIGKIVEVKAFDIIESDDKISLFLPRFVSFREDKDEADTLDRIYSISKMIK